MNDKRRRFETLVHSLAHELYRYAYRLCGERHQAEDLVQETFLRAWRALQELRDESAVRGWLYTILRREHARLYQRDRPEPRNLSDFDVAAMTDYDTSTEAFVLRRGIAGLSEDYRTPLLLQVLGGFSCGEIARMLDLSPDAVMARVSRARRKLGQTLAQKEAKTNQKVGYQ